MITTTQQKHARQRVAKKATAKAVKPVSKRVLERMDADVENLRKGKVSAPIDLEKYAEYR